mmetsp:Transcript_2890/g.8642  ORF Transcript_2890/g.8642 Transcript_2890/m.8642 type:complete len:348 (+) Transcript_2890:171-1214(+)
MLRLGVARQSCCSRKPWARWRLSQRHRRRKQTRATCSESQKLWVLMLSAHRARKAQASLPALRGGCHPLACAASGASETPCCHRAACASFETLPLLLHLLQRQLPPTLLRHWRRSFGPLPGWRSQSLHHLPRCRCRPPLRPLPPRPRKAAARRHVLELGAGTGGLAIELAQGGFASAITATDGEPGVVKNMKYNVQANRLGHAVRCRRWDWGQEPPDDLDLSSVDICIGSDVVYYDRPHADLAAALRRVLAAARAPEKAPVRVFLLLMLRAAEAHGGRVVHRVSAQGYRGGAVERFLEVELPEQLLRAERLPIPLEAFQGCLCPLAREAWESPSSQEAAVFYEVLLQ